MLVVCLRVLLLFLWFVPRLIYYIHVHHCECIVVLHSVHSIVVRHRNRFQASNMCVLVHIDILVATCTRLSIRHRHAHANQSRGERSTFTSFSSSELGGGVDLYFQRISGGALTKMRSTASIVPACDGKSQQSRRCNVRGSYDDVLQGGRQGGCNRRAGEPRVQI